jgi:glucans biosynthesis protein C
MATERYTYIDNIRIWMTVLVILHHAAVTYGAPGSWYYSEKGDSLLVGLVLTVFVATNQAFFMGFFFFLSSFFIPASYEKKGSSKFILDRLKRLGIPLIFYTLILGPATIYIAIRYGEDMQLSFSDYYFNKKDWIGFGVLWFTAALLLFTFVYWLIPKDKSGSEPLAFPKNRVIFLFAILLGIVSFLVRIFFPIGWTLDPLGFQLGHFTQYIALFVIGIVAFQNKWLQAITYETGMFWLKVAAITLFIGFPGIYSLKFITNSPIEVFQGGFTIYSLLVSLWEQLMGISIILAFLGIARVKATEQGALGKEMSRSAYAAYIIHPLILVLISVLLQDIQMHLLLKFVIVGCTAVITTFALSYILVRLPLVKEVV